MKAIEIKAPGGPEVLQIGELPKPEPGKGQVLVKVHAAGVNRPDILQRQGGYPPPPGAPATPGLEIAGEVMALGEGTAATGLATGFVRWCQVVAMRSIAWWRKTMPCPMPLGFSMIEAAAIPETYFTVWTNVFDRARLQPGETILIHGGSSGIGTTTIQLTKAFGATVVVTAGSDEKCAECIGLGADVAINYDPRIL